VFPQEATDKIFTEVKEQDRFLKTPVRDAICFYMNVFVRRNFPQFSANDSVEQIICEFKSTGIDVFSNRH